MSIKAMKQALEALEEFGNHDNACPQWPTYSEPEKYPKCNCGYEAAITALRQAIAEAEKQEPVGKFSKFTDGVWREVTSGSAGVFLYTHPQQKREWVGLTDDEIKELHTKWNETNSWDGWNYERAIEAKLRERNT